MTLLFRKTILIAIWLLVLAAGLGGCIELVYKTPTPPGIVTEPAPGSEWYNLYFSNPRSPTAKSYRGGLDAALAAAIDQARLSVDVAIYDFNLWGLRDALIDARQRGVTVRVVAESDNLDRKEMGELKDAGIPILGDRREGLMHNKFVIIDRSEVWTGSMNFTTSGAYLNNNHLLRIRSARLAEDYTAEFEEMFTDDLFGPDIRVNTPYPSITIDGTLLEIYFSPDDGTERALLNLINSAQNSIYFLAYSFTSDDIAQAMLERAATGVTVAGVFEESQYASNIGCEFDPLSKAGINVRLDGNPNNMHHKVMVIDSKIVVVGSYNFSASAEERNDENTLIIHNPQIAVQFLGEFKKIFDEAQK